MGLQENPHAEFDRNAEGIHAAKQTFRDIMTGWIENGVVGKGEDVQIPCPTFDDPSRVVTLPCPKLVGVGSPPPCKAKE